MKDTVIKTIGLVGAGRIGSQIARLAVAKNYNVVISNSRGPQTLSALVAELGPRARAATAADAAKAGDVVVVTVPLKNYRAVPVEPLAGKIVIDTNNYYPERDGHIAELDNESTTTSELLQAHLPTSKIVKAFNHIYAAALTTDFEAIEIGPVRLEAGDFDMDGMRKLRPGGRRTARHDGSKCLVGGDLPRNRNNRHRHAAVRFERLRSDPRPDDETVRRRIARRYPKAERLAAPFRLRPNKRRRGDQRCGGGRYKAPAGQHRTGLSAV